MAKVFLNADESFILSNPATVFGSTGTETVIIYAGTTGVVVDQNVERVNLPGTFSAFQFQQGGNRLLVYSGANLLATIPLQGDSDGTQIGTDAGVSASAKLATNGVMTLGGAVVPTSAPGVVTPTIVDGTAVTVSAPNGTAYNASTANVTFNVANPSANYTYNINGFGSGDHLIFPAGSSPTVVNSIFTDNAVDVQLASSGNVVVIHLTGLAAGQDNLLNNVDSFNTVFGSGTIMIV